MAEEKTDDDSMTPEERLAYLRERGIEVNTPEERKASMVANALREANNLEGQEQQDARAVSYVLIPADKSQDFQEFSFVPPPLGTGGVATSDPLATHLKRAFRDKSDQVDLSLMNKVGDGAASLLGSNGAPASVSDATLRQVAAEGNVETFALVHPTASNQYTGVNIYLDEVGMLKRLPLNARASDLALRAGFNPPPQFYGDVFVGRVQSRPCARNLSFRSTGGNVAPDAEWLQRATMQNLEYQMEMNRLTGRSDTQASVAGQDGKEKLEEGYSWTQTEEELEIVVGLATEATSKEIKVKFNSTLIEIIYQKAPKVVLKLFHRVDVDSGTWTLEKGSDKRKLVVTVEKVEAGFWPRIED